jgi:hypothetical protein
LLLSEIKLRKIIRQVLLEQELTVDASTKTEFEKNSKKIKEIIDNGFKDEKDRFVRKLYANNFSDRVRVKVKEALPENCEEVTGFSRDEIANYIIPVNREQRFKNVKNKKDPYYLNYFARLVEKFEQKIIDLKVNLDTESEELTEWYRDYLSNYGRNVSGRYLSQKKGINIYSAADYEKHIGPAGSGGMEEVSAKFKSALGLIGGERGWIDFDKAVRSTLSHEIGHAWDAILQKAGYDKITNVARRSLFRYNKLYPDASAEITAKPTDNTGKNIGSMEVKEALMPVIRPGYHKHIEGVGKPSGVPYAAPDTAYINLHTYTGQSEVLARIRQIKQIPGSGQGVGLFNEDHIQYMKDYVPKLKSVGLSDVVDLYYMLRDDVTNKQIADAFNKVAPSG